MHCRHEPLGIKTRGLCLASTWFRKASLADTSPRTVRGIGQHDNLPVCNQNLPEAERYAPMDVVLPWPSPSFNGCVQEPNYSSGGQCPDCLSLRGLLPICQECLGRGQSVFRQHVYSSTCVQNVQGYPPLRRAIPPLAEAVGLPCPNVCEPSRSRMLRQEERKQHW